MFFWTFFAGCEACVLWIGVGWGLLCLSAAFLMSVLIPSRLLPVWGLYRRPLLVLLSLWTQESVDSTICRWRTRSVKRRSLGDQSIPAVSRRGRLLTGPSVDGGHVVLRGVAFVLVCRPCWVCRLFGCYYVVTYDIRSHLCSSALSSILTAWYLSDLIFGIDSCGYFGNCQRQRLINCFMCYALS